MRTHEEIVGVRIGAANLEQLHEIVKLAMYIATNSDGAFLGHVSEGQQVQKGGTYHWLHVRLLLEHLSRL